MNFEKKKIKMNDEEAFCECFIHVCVIPMFHCWKCVIDNASNCCCPHDSSDHMNESNVYFDVSQIRSFPTRSIPTLVSPPDVNMMGLPDVSMEPEKKNEEMILMRQ